MEEAKTTAELLAEFSRKHVAWNMPKELQSELIAIRVNQHGTAYTFIDGSVAFVPKGQAEVQMRPKRWDLPKKP
jgi:hypothetical protein